MNPTTQAIYFATDADREAAASWLAANILTATIQQNGSVEGTDYHHLVIAFADIEDARRFYSAAEVKPYDPPVQEPTSDSV